MEYKVRPARAEDVPGIQSWTRDTFLWGDYVAEALPSWLEDANGRVIVVADETDTPIAVGLATMLSPTEGWLRGARVRTEHRRRGLGTLLNQAGVAWARDQGARVVRLVTERDNVAARSQVEKLGYRLVSGWVWGAQEVGDDQPRLIRGERLEPAPVSDVDPAWMFWSMSDLAATGRNLMASGWEWRRATPQDLKEAASEHRLWQAPSGWVTLRDQEGHLDVGWVATAAADAPRLLHAIVFWAADGGSRSVAVKLPATAWATEALKRSGFEVGELVIYATPV